MIWAISLVIWTVSPVCWDVSPALRAESEVYRRRSECSGAGSRRIFSAKPVFAVGLCVAQVVSEVGDKVELRRVGAGGLDEQAQGRERFAVNVLGGEDRHHLLGQLAHLRSLPRAQVKLRKVHCNKGGVEAHSSLQESRLDLAERTLRLAGVPEARGDLPLNPTTSQSIERLAMPPENLPP